MAKTPNPDPLHKGTLPLIGAVDADYRVTVQFSNPLDDGVSLSGIAARLTCFDDSLVLKSFDLQGDGSPAVSSVLPNQMNLIFDVRETGDSPDYDLPVLEITSMGNALDSNGNPVGIATITLLDIDAV